MSRAEQTVDAAIEVLDSFQEPEIKDDENRKAGNAHFVVHYWPVPFTTVDAYIGHDYLLPEVITPIWPRNYHTRHLGEPGEDLNVQVPDGGFVRPFKPGHAVNCLRETYGKRGLANLISFVDAGTKWSDIKAFQHRVLTATASLPAFNRTEARIRALTAVRREGVLIETEAEDLALGAMIKSNQDALKELKAWATNRITAAAKAERSGLGRVHATDIELDWFMAGGVRIPTFMSTYSNRTDIETTDEKPDIDHTPDNQHVEQALSLTADMVQMVKEMQVAQASNERIYQLEAALAEQNAQIAKLTAMLEKPKGGKQ